MAFINLVFTDGRSEKREVGLSNGKLLIKKDSLPEKVDHIDFMPGSCTAKVGDKGFFMLPSMEGSHHFIQTFFKERPDVECVFPESSLPVYGFCREGKATLAVVTGMRFEYSVVAGVKAGQYYLYPRFLLNGEKPYEDIEILFFDLSSSDASYAGMARRYRKYQLDRGACLPLKKRAEKNPVLKEMAHGPEVRIRLAWKPVPSQDDDQTLENEPPVHIQLTFKQVEEIIEEFHRQGIEHAEFCLVGWNIGGHDGRYPDIFPVEPGCGAEEDLKKLISKAKSYGYLIVCHTNVLDSYSIAKRFKKDNTIVNRDGTLKRGGNWGGGKSYFMCPKKAHEDYFVEDAKNLKKLGFKGAHYLDVMSILTPDACHNPAHPLTRKGAAEWRSKTLALARKTFGASASEGSWDFCANDLDYVLYAAFWLNEPKDKIPALCDKFIPFWFIVYHGIQLYNCFADSVNACSKSDKTLSLRNYAWGGRPLSYFYSKFMTKGLDGSAGNPWGQEDIGYSSPEQLKETVAIIKADYERYQKLCDLQYEFIEDIEELPGNVFKTTYSNGSAVVCELDKNVITRTK